MARRIRALAQYVLYPFDRASYAAYAALRSRRATIEPLEIGTACRNVLLLAPHQDDELLGCGGFIVKYKDRCSIQIAYVTNGEGRSHRSPEARRALVMERKLEARAVASELGLSEPIFLDFDDGRVRQEQRLVPALEKLIADLAPDMIMAPFITDGHRDHVATTLALASVSGSLVDARRICLYQVHSHIPDRLLNACVALSRAEEGAKERALRLYASQDMGRALTLSKYLLFSRVAPQIVKPAGAHSVEHFATMSGAQLRELAASIDPDVIVPRLKTTSYAPYSFRNFLSNRKLLDEATAGRPAAARGS